MMKNLKVLFVIAIIIICIPFSGCSDDKSIDFENAQVAVQVLKTGKSDCIFVDIEGYTILIDCADEDDFPLIDSMLKDRGEKNLDLMIITHFDNDHIGSAAKVIDSYPTKEIVMPNYVRHSKPMRSLLEALEGNPQIKVSKLDKQDYKIQLESGVTIDINSPKNNYGVEDNPNSLISILTLNNGEKLLFTGDATKERLAEFFSDNKDSFVFAKMPHHGSYNTEVKKLLTERDLAYAAITVNSLDDAEAKMLTFAKTIPVKTLYTCDGDIFLLYKDGKYEYYQLNN